MSKKHKRKHKGNKVGGFNGFHGGDYYTGYGSYYLEDRRSFVEFDKDFAVHMSAELHKKLFSYVRSTNDEVSGLGLVRQIDNGYEIYDIFVLKQVSTGAHTDLDTGEMSKLICTLIKEKKNVNDLRFWWHSHPTFGTEWSGTDDATCKRLANDKFMVAWCVNHKYDIRCRVELTKPFNMTIDKISATIDGEMDKEIDDTLAKEALSKVESRKFSYFGSDDKKRKHNNFYYDWDRDEQRMVKKYYALEKTSKDDGQLRKAADLLTRLKSGVRTLYINPFGGGASYDPAATHLCHLCTRAMCEGCSRYENYKKAKKKDKGVIHI